MSRELKELETLAEEFIIGYVPLTPKQKRIKRNIDQLEAEWKRIMDRQKRIERVLTVLYSKL